MSFQRLKDHAISQHKDFFSRDSAALPEIELLSDDVDCDTANAGDFASKDSNMVRFVSS